MWAANRKRIEALAADKLVLDIGGWADPLLRANYVMDVLPYDTRYIGYHGIGTLPCSVTYPAPREGEQFTRDTWIIHDICSRKPFPFPDKKFDFVVCSHTLEDIRDPIWACSEIMRIGRAGYIETPSRLWEQTRRPSGMIGEGHHRWMVEIEGTHIRFSCKPHFLYTDRKYFVPHVFFEREKQESDKITYLFWEDAFTFEEPFTYWNSEVEAYINRLQIPPRDYVWDHLRNLRLRWWQVEGALLKRLHRQTENAPPPSACWTWERLFNANEALLAQTPSEVKPR